MVSFLWEGKKKKAGHFLYLGDKGGRKRREEVVRSGKERKGGKNDKKKEFPPLEVEEKLLKRQKEMKQNDIPITPGENRGKKSIASQWGEKWKPAFSPHRKKGGKRGQRDSHVGERRGKKKKDAAIRPPLFQI